MQAACSEAEGKLTKEVRLDLALGLCEGIRQHLALDGQVLYLEDLHQALDAVPAKHPEQAAPSTTHLTWLSASQSTPDPAC